MTLTRFICALALATAASTSLAAQKPTDFSGTWVEDPSRRVIVAPDDPPAPKGMPVIGGPPPELIITQTPTAIQIDQPWMHGVVRHTFKLDGSKSVNRNGANTMTTTSRWEKDRLVTEGTSYSETSAGEFTWKHKDVRWIDAAGSLFVETTDIDEAGKKRVVTRVFRKKR